MTGVGGRVCADVEWWWGGGAIRAAMHYTLRVLNAGRERRTTDVRGKIPLGFGRGCVCVCVHATGRRTSRHFTGRQWAEIRCFVLTKTVGELAHPLLRFSPDQGKFIIWVKDISRRTPHCYRCDMRSVSKRKISRCLNGPYSVCVQRHIEQIYSTSKTN